MTMMMQTYGLDRLSREEKIALCEELQNEIQSTEPANHLSEAQIQEIDRRCAEEDNNPSALLKWEDVEKRMFERFQK